MATVARAGHQLSKYKFVGVFLFRDLQIVVYSSLVLLGTVDNFVGRFGCDCHYCKGHIDICSILHSFSFIDLIGFGFQF